VNNLSLLDRLQRAGALLIKRNPRAAALFAEAHEALRQQEHAKYLEAWRERLSALESEARWYRSRAELIDAEIELLRENIDQLTGTENEIDHERTRHAGMASGTPESSDGE
jgi:chromosome segregation ATPase